MAAAAPPSASSSVIGSSNARSCLASNGFSVPIGGGPSSVIGNKCKSITNTLNDKKRASTVYTRGGDSDTATFDQLMGEIHSNGCTLRKRNWDRNHSGGTSRSPIDRSTMSGTNHWSRNPDNVWGSESNCLQSPYHSMVLENNTTASSVLKSPKDEAKDITFWTNVFFNNAAANDAPILHSINTNNNNNISSTNAANKDRNGRRSSATSIVIGQLMNDKSEPNSSNASSSSSSYLYTADDTAGAAAIPTTSYENAGRYAAIQSGIKRKNNLSKTKISTNLNGESERLPKSTDLFLLPSSSGGNIYSRLGLTDVSPSTDGSRFIQVGATFLMFVFL